MLGIFGQVFSAFQGLLSRAFWFGSLLPVALFAAFNLLMVKLEFPTDVNLTEIVGKDWSWTPAVLVVLVIVAYALGPLIPLFRGLLDARSLPDWIQRLLRRRPLEERRRKERSLTGTAGLVEKIRFIRTDAVPQFQRERAVGIATGAAHALKEIEEAENQTRSLDDQLTHGKIDDAKIKKAVDTVAAALRMNAVTLMPPEPGAAEAERLRAVHLRMINLLKNAEQDANRQVVRQAEELRQLPQDIQPTEVGNARVRAERYCSEMYNVDFNYLWPRLQFVIPKEDPATTRIETAKALVDFSVLSLVLSVAFLLGWLVVLAVHDNSPWKFLLLGAVGPLLTGFFYRLVVETQISFGDVVQGVVDRFRFELLKMLHVKAPASLADERQIWAWFDNASRGGSINPDVAWTAPP